MLQHYSGQACDISVASQVCRNRWKGPGCWIHSTWAKHQRRTSSVSSVSSWKHWRPVRQEAAIPMGDSIRQSFSTARGTVIFIMLSLNPSQCYLTGNFPGQAGRENVHGTSPYHRCHRTRWTCERATCWCTHTCNSGSKWTASVRTLQILNIPVGTPSTFILNFRWIWVAVRQKKFRILQKQLGRLHSHHTAWWQDCQAFISIPQGYQEPQGPTMGGYIQGCNVISGHCQATQ